MFEVITYLNLINDKDSWLIVLDNLNSVEKPLTKEILGYMIEPLILI